MAECSDDQMLSLSSLYLNFHVKAWLSQALKVGVTGDEVNNEALVISVFEKRPEEGRIVIRLWSYTLVSESWLCGFHSS